MFEASCLKGIDVQNPNDQQTRQCKYWTDAIKLIGEHNIGQI